MFAVASDRVGRPLLWARSPRSGRNRRRPCRGRGGRGRDPGIEVGSSGARVPGLGTPSGTTGARMARDRGTGQCPLPAPVPGRPRGEVDCPPSDGWFAAQPDPIYRLIHVENLDTGLFRGGLYAPNHTPPDGIAYRTIHRQDVQEGRRVHTVPKGPGGTVHDYVAFLLRPSVRDALPASHRLGAGLSRRPGATDPSRVDMPGGRGRPTFGSCSPTGTAWRDSRPGTTISLISTRSTGMRPTRRVEGHAGGHGPSAP